MLNGVPKRKGKFVYPNAELIRTLRDKQGWSVLDLAYRAPVCCDKTVMRLEEGHPCTLKTIEKFSKKFKVEPAILLNYDDAPPEIIPEDMPSIPPGARRKVEFVLDVPVDEFDECERVIKFIEATIRLACPKYYVELKDIVYGSVIYQLEMSEYDLSKLIISIAKNHTDELREETDYIVCEDFNVPNITKDVGIKLYGSNKPRPVSEADTDPNDDEEDFFIKDYTASITAAGIGDFEKLQELMSQFEHHVKSYIRKKLVSYDHHELYVVEDIYNAAWVMLLNNFKSLSPIPSVYDMLWFLTAYSLDRIEHFESSFNLNKLKAWNLMARNATLDEISQSSEINGVDFLAMINELKQMGLNVAEQYYPKGAS